MSATQFPSSLVCSFLPLSFLHDIFGVDAVLCASRLLNSVIDDAYGTGACPLQVQVTDEEKQETDKSASSWAYHIDEEALEGETKPVATANVEETGDEPVEGIHDGVGRLAKQERHEHVDAGNVDGCEGAVVAHAGITVCKEGYAGQHQGGKTLADNTLPGRKNNTVGEGAARETTDKDGGAKVEAGIGTGSNKGEPHKENAEPEAAKREDPHNETFEQLIASRCGSDFDLGIILVFLAFAHHIFLCRPVRQPPGGPDGERDEGVNVCASQLGIHHVEEKHVGTPSEAIEEEIDNAVLWRILDEQVGEHKHVAHILTDDVGDEADKVEGLPVRLAGHLARRWIDLLHVKGRRRVVAWNVGEVTIEAFAMTEDAVVDSNAFAGLSIGHVLLVLWSDERRIGRSGKVGIRWRRPTW